MNLIFQTNTKYQNVKIYDDEHFGRILFLDNDSQFSLIDERFYHEFFVHPFIQPNDNVLLIGGGDGGCLRELKKYTNDIDWVEIDADIPKICSQYFPQLNLNGTVFEQINSHFIDFDTYNTTKQYDLVLADLTVFDYHNKILNLKNYIKSTGIITTHISLKYSNSEINTIIDTLNENFKYIQLFYVPIACYKNGGILFVSVSDSEIKLNNNPIDTKVFNTTYNLKYIPNYIDVNI